MLTHFDLGDKVTLFPQCNVDPSHGSLLKHSLIGWGNYDKSENLCFLLNNVMPHFLFQ